MILYFSRFRSIALKVVPTHSYALLEVDDGKILGNPTLKVHGDVKESDTNGLALNGNNAYMSAQFKNSDCLIDPGLCSDGFTVSMKLEFEDPLKSNEARYIIDTGAHMGSSPGVSMFLKGDKLHYQLTANGKTWSVSIQYYGRSFVATWYFNVHKRGLVTSLVYTTTRYTCLSTFLIFLECILFLRQF